MKSALAALDKPQPDMPFVEDTVIGGHFGAPLNARKLKPRTKPESHISTEDLENFDRAIGLNLSRG